PVLAKLDDVMGIARECWRIGPTAHAEQHDWPPAPCHRIGDRKRERTTATNNAERRLLGNRRGRCAHPETQPVSSAPCRAMAMVSGRVPVRMNSTTRLTIG